MHPLILVLLFLFSSPALAKAIDVPDAKKSPPIAAVVERVIDGSTFVTAGNEIKLWGITTPNSDDPYYIAAKLYLETILNEAPHSCHYIQKDESQRYIMKCFSNGQDISAMMVRMGVARDYEQQSSGAYKHDEDHARKNSYGIWKKGHQ